MLSCPMQSEALTMVGFVTFRFISSADSPLLHQYQWLECGHPVRSTSFSFFCFRLLLRLLLLRLWGWHRAPPRILTCRMQVMSTQPDIEQRTMTLPFLYSLLTYTCPYSFIHLPYMVTAAAAPALCRRSTSSILAGETAHMCCTSAFIPHPVHHITSSRTSLLSDSGWHGFGHTVLTYGSTPLSDTLTMAYGTVTYGGKAVTHGDNGLQCALAQVQKPSSSSESLQPTSASTFLPPCIIVVNNTSYANKRSLSRSKQTSAASTSVSTPRSQPTSKQTGNHAQRNAAQADQSISSRFDTAIESPATGHLNTAPGAT